MHPDHREVLAGLLERRPVRPRRWVRVVRAGAAFAVVLLVGSAVTVGLTYRHYANNIHHVTDALQTSDANIRDRVRQLHAANYLVIGSDTRAGKNSSIPGTADARSDTTMLVHLSPDRTHATVVSFPRDAWVSVPACRAGDGQVLAARDDQFNSAFTQGGARCTVALVQKLTGIGITHYVEIDFSGFTSLVRSLGGITVCSPEAVDDENSTLKLHPGNNKLTPDQALAYVRARESLGDGSDLGRIQRQQRFLGAVLRQARGGHLLADPAQLTSFLNAASKAVTVDTGTSVRDLKALVDALRGLDPAKVTFYTAPIANRAYDPNDPSSTHGSRVLLDAATGRVLYDRIIADRTLTVRPSSPRSTPSTPSSPASAAPTPLNVTVAPGDIAVAVTNGVGTTDLATQVQQALSGAGFRPGVLGLEPQGATTTTVRYAPAQLAAARTVAAAIPGSVLAADAAHTGDIEVIVGTSYRGVTPVKVGDRLPSSLQPTASQPTSGGPTSRSPTDNPAPTPTGISAADTSCTE